MYDVLVMEPKTLYLSEPKRPKIVERWVARGLIRPAFEGKEPFLSVWANQLPEFTWESLPRIRRWHLIRDALNVDRVLTMEQLFRHFAAEPYDLDQLWRRVVTVRPVHGRQGRVRTCVCAREPHHLMLTPPALAKRLALAEVRLTRAIPPNLWTTPVDYGWYGPTLEASIAGEQSWDHLYSQDAIAQVGEQQEAVVYDRGTYFVAQAVIKIRTLLGGDRRVIWAIPEAQNPKDPLVERRNSRAAHLRRRLREAGLSERELERVLILPIDWWRTRRDPIVPESGEPAA